MDAAPTPRVNATILQEHTWSDSWPAFYNLMPNDFVSGYFMLEQRSFPVVDIYGNAISLYDIPHEAEVEIFFVGDIDDSYPAGVGGPVLLRVWG